MGVNAGELLKIMEFRLRMQKEGNTNPHSSVKRATEQLVKKLSSFEASESIEIQILSSNPVLAKYIRLLNGEVLAEINEQEYT